MGDRDRHPADKTPNYLYVTIWDGCLYKRGREREREILCITFQGAVCWLGTSTDGIVSYRADMDEYVVSTIYQVYLWVDRCGWALQ